MEPIKLIPLHAGRAETWASGAENYSVHLTYDVSNYLKSWPDAQPSVAFERADGEKYPHAWELDGPVLHIPLLLADTEVPGMCKCMITMLSGDGRANTVVFYGSVTEGIDSLGEEPADPMLGIIEQVNLAAADANAAKVGAEDAQDAAVEAQTAAEEAQGKAEEAKVSAESARDVARLYRESAHEHSQTSLNAKIAAENAADDAQDSATDAENHATDAKNYANAAQNSANAAQNSANDSASSAAAADASADAAQRHAAAAQESLENMEERYYVPSVDDEGNLSFTPTSNEMAAVPTVNIRGPQGIQGIRGEIGPVGPAGETGATGADGVSPTISIEDIAGGHRLTITDKDGTKTVDVMNGAQADWNENDETSPNYVQNRTHWKEKTSSVFFPEKNLTEDTLTSDGWPVTEPISNKPAAGTICTVTWNGTAYNCPVQEAEGESEEGTFTVIGNGEIMGMTGNGEPFVVLIVPDAAVAAMGAYGIILPLDGSTSATVSMAGESETVHPLPKEYLGELRGQEQITITIAEDGTVTSDTAFRAAFALDERELQTAIRIVTNVNDPIAGKKIEHQYSACGVCKFDAGNGYAVIHITYLPYTDLKDAPGMQQAIFTLTWTTTPYGEAGFDTSAVFSLPRCWSTQAGETLYLEWSASPDSVGDNDNPAGPGMWHSVTKDDFKESLGLSALKADNAGKGLKVAGDGTMAADMYQQPDWGSETAIVELLPETELSIMSEDEPMAVIQEKVTLVSGAVYTVNYNGTEYECTAYEGDNVVMIGNAAADGGEDTGEPFFLGFYDDTFASEMGFYGLIVPLDGSETFTLSIKGEGEVVHAIPAKYTDNVMRVTVANDMTADKTFDEISAAINSGAFVYVFCDMFGDLTEYGYVVFTLAQFVEGAGIGFHNGSFSRLLSYKSDGTIEISGIG